jgi:hypothetical protein
MVGEFFILKKNKLKKLREQAKAMAAIVEYFLEETK